MKFAWKILLIGLLVTLAAAQSSRRRTSSSAATATATSRAASAQEQSRTLGLFGPLLRLGLGGLRRTPVRTGTQSSALSDPYYGGSYGGSYGGYPSTNSVYGNYGNYQNYGGLNGVGYGGGYRPPTAVSSYNTGYQQNYGGLGGLSSLSSFGTSGNSQVGSYAPTAGVGAAAQGGNSAQQAQLATLLGQALGSSLRPLLNGGRFGTAAAGAAQPALGYGYGSSNPFIGLLGLFG